jgi:hypothetical protein
LIILLNDIGVKEGGFQGKLSILQWTEENNAGKKI